MDFSRRDKHLRLDIKGKSYVFMNYPLEEIFDSEVIADVWKDLYWSSWVLHGMKNAFSRTCGGDSNRWTITNGFCRVILCNFEISSTMVWLRIRAKRIGCSLSISVIRSLNQISRDSFLLTIFYVFQSGLSEKGMILSMRVLRKIKLS